MAKIKFIPIEQLLEIQANNGKFRLVDVLTKESYDEGHIPGAINIPLDVLNEQAGNKLKKGDKIVVYCAGYGCHASTKAADILLKKGFKNTLDFKAGKQGWVDAKLELEK